MAVVVMVKSTGFCLYFVHCLDKFANGSDEECNRNRGIDICSKFLGLKECKILTVIY